MTLIIRTTTREADADYLPALLDAVEAEGKSGVILTDGPIPRTRPGWDAVCTGAVKGSRLSGWACLRYIAASGQDGLLLEDDVLPVGGGVARMLGFEVPKHHAFLSFFDIRIPWFPRVPGIYSEGSDQFMQAQALKIPLATAQRLQDEDPTRIHRAGFNPLHAFDLCLGVLAAELVCPTYGIVWPNLVQHVGDQSAVEPRRNWKLRSGWLAGSDE